MLIKNLFCFVFSSSVIKTQSTLRTLVQWTCQCEILRTEDFTQKRFTLYHGYTMEMMLTRMTVHTVSATVLDQQQVSSQYSKMNICQNWLLMIYSTVFKDTLYISVRERTVKIGKGMGEYPWGFRIQFSKPILVTEVDTSKLSRLQN